MALIFYPYEWLVLTALFGFSTSKIKDYCMVKCKEGQHTMCEKFFKPGGTDCSKYEVYLTHPEINFIVDEINKWRQSVANGRMKHLPRASNMVMLHWDEEAEEIASRWAEQCDQVTEDSCRRQLFTSRDDGGQCISSKGGQRGPGEKDWARKPVLKEVVEYWFSLGKGLNNDSIDVYRPTADVVKYFTQLAWAHTNRVGCGFSVTGNIRSAKFKLVCNFYEEGNIEGLAVYMRGEPCSACPPRYPHCSEKFPGLCTVKPRAPSHSTLVECSRVLLTILTGNLILIHTYML